MSVESVPYEALGRPIRGPRALTDDWGRFWHLTFNIAFTQWKLRFFGSALGYLWQLVRPLLLFTVLYVFFTQIGHVGIGVGPSGAFYGTQLLGSIVLYTFFAEATIGSVRSVLDNETLVRKIQFPRLVIPLSVLGADVLPHGIAAVPEGPYTRQLRCDFFSAFRRRLQSAQQQ